MVSVSSSWSSSSPAVTVTVCGSSQFEAVKTGRMSTDRSVPAGANIDTVTAEAGLEFSTTV